MYSKIKQDLILKKKFWFEILLAWKIYANNEKEPFHLAESDKLDISFNV